MCLRPSIMDVNTQTQHDARNTRYLSRKSTMAHICIPGAPQENLRFEVNVGYVVSSRQPGLHSKTLSPKKKNKKAGRGGARL